MTRAYLPSEYFDITSAKLLTQPEPQYLHFEMFKAALGATLAVPGALGMPNRTAGSEGAGYAQLSESQLELANQLRRECMQVVTGWGTFPGHTIRMNRPAFTNSTYTDAVRTIDAGSTVSTTATRFGQEQVAITVKRVGGPYDTAIQPYTINEFDGSKSLHSQAEMVGLHMRRDLARFVDAHLITLWDSVTSANLLYAGGMTAVNDSTVAGGGSYPFDLDLVFRGMAQLDSTDIPRFSNGRRICVCTPRQILQLKSDSQFAHWAEKFPEKNPIFPNFIATVGDVDFYQSNTLTKTVNASSVAIHRAQLFGPGKVGAGLASMPVVRASADDNYGMDIKVIWTMDWATANFDDRFGCKLHSD